MKTLVIFLFCLPALAVVPSNLAAQGYAADISLGVGNVIGVDHPYGKIQLGIMCVRDIMDDRAQVGIEITMGGNFIPGDDGADDITGVEHLDAANANWTGLQMRGRYFISGETLRPYIGIGVGANNYWFNVNAVDTETVNQWNLGLTPEVGLGINQLNLSLRYLRGGKTPDFVGTRPVQYGGNEVILSSEKLDIILVTLGYTFVFGG